MITIDEIMNRKEKISVIGLGYVGIPLAVAFSKKANVIGFDVSKKKIEAYKAGLDPTNEVGESEIKACSIEFTSDANLLKKARFHIIAVPTPVKPDNSPDLSFIENASAIAGSNLTKGSLVVYESTVYPGVTEELCIPILENKSGLRCGVDFKVGYSPERINPGDKEHRLENIVKIVSGMDEETLELVSAVYSLVVDAGVFKAESIMTAEAAKVIENSQRDINIAFINELSIIFDKMGIDTKAVLEAAGSKWNFLSFQPGLVGGHCIGVDPYYLTYKAKQLGYNSQVILSGRNINDYMGKYVANTLIKLMIKVDIPVKNSRVAILGFTFKENCPDARNTRVIDIIRELEEYGVNTIVSDSVCDVDSADEYGISLVDLECISNADAVILAVAHDRYKSLSEDEIKKLFKPDEPSERVIIDIKGILDRKEFTGAGYVYWRL